MATATPNETTLKLWEKLLEKRMFYDGTNQRRLRNFMTVEATIMLGFVIVLSQAFAYPLILPQFVFLVLGGSLCIMGYLLARRTSRLHANAQRHLRALRGQIHALETQIQPVIEDLSGAPKPVSRHRRRRRSPSHFAGLVAKGIKHRFERGRGYRPDRLLIHATAMAWLVAFICTLCVMAVLLTPDWRVAMVKLSYHALKIAV